MFLLFVFHGFSYLQHVSSGQTTDIVSVITEGAEASEPVDANGMAQTQVIYYIEDGTVAR